MIWQIQEVVEELLDEEEGSYFDDAEQTEERREEEQEWDRQEGEQATIGGRYWGGGMDSYLGSGSEALVASTHPKTDIDIQTQTHTETQRHT